jgi:hypothetical protein
MDVMVHEVMVESSAVFRVGHRKHWLRWSENFPVVIDFSIGIKMSD